ncbi:response regulator [Aequorivita marisscotiae]|uniref:Response regulator n=1 Tax=Aequorivita marisscotiae TaxID=3040348 RepID=A0ABY8KWU3_9FLAO|nr:response regulator [Aequorivita sp. Ant34-E75]WGF92650.1 response regulator [Aequorivita sp. Ant34-E75]
MFKKVLISDDLDCINQGVIAVLQALKVEAIAEVVYCDDAFLKIEKAILEKAPFDLLITDLSYTPDHREQTFSSGEDLIAALKKKHPELPIIAYSVEDRLQRVRSLVVNHKLNGYVCKGRRGLEELKTAIHKVFEGETYLSPQVENALSKKSTPIIEDYDIALMEQLANGLSQKEISEHFRSVNIVPSSLSSIEKRVGKLCIHFKVKNAIHLVATVKDLGLI